MKLSEIKGERSIDVIAEVLEQVSKIAQDEEALKFFTEKPKVDEKGNFLEPIEKFVMKRIGEKLPYLLKNHKTELYTIFAVMENVELKEYVDTVTVSKIIKSIADLFTDESITSLFTSVQPNEGDK
jgi:hypothetical protein